MSRALLKQPSQSRPESLTQLETTRAARWYKEREYAVVFLVALIYIAMIGRYRAYDLDTVWWLSFSHSYWVQHIPTDTLMLFRFPFGMGGVVAFGKLPGIVQGILLGLFGWSYVAAVGISIAFVVLGLLLFANACRRFGYGINFTCCAVALLGLTESFVSASQKARGEFLSVFLLCLALWLGSRSNIVFSMFVAALAAEVQPAAIVIPIAIFVMLVLRNRLGQRTGWFLLQAAAGTAAAAAIYFLLHPHILTTVRSAPWGNLRNGTFPGGFVGAYYFVTRRHLPELALLLSAVGTRLLVGKRDLLLHWPALCSLTIIIMSVLLHWANPPYFAFLSPFVCLFILEALYSDRYFRWFLAGILVLTLPQYVYRFYYWQSRDAGFSQEDEQRVAGVLDRVAASEGKAPAQLHIVGNYNLWFAHPSNFINLDTRAVNEAMLRNADVLLCFDKPVDPILAPSQITEIPCASLNSVPSKTVAVIPLHGHQVQVRIPIHPPS